MKALQLLAPNQLQINDIPKPSNLKPGEVLIKMEFSPVNPSDLAFLTGGYGIQKAFPCVPGFEGSGVVVDSGGGIYANYLKGKTVTCVASTKYDGTWAEYMKTEAAQCVVLSKNVSLQQGSMSFVNPLTALDFIDIAKKDGFKTIIMSAAGSALAKLVAQLAHENNLTVAGIVRKPEAMDVLTANGFDKAFCSESDTWEADLKAWAKGRGKMLFPDCIGGGSIPSKILACLPVHSRILTYGSLDFSKPQTIVARDFIFSEYEIHGYWLSRMAGRKSFLKKLSQTRKVQNMLKQGFENKIQSISPLEDYQNVFKNSFENATAGKCLFTLA